MTTAGCSASLILKFITRELGLTAKTYKNTHVWLCIIAILVLNLVNGSSQIPSVLSTKMEIAIIQFVYICARKSQNTLNFSHTKNEDILSLKSWNC